MEQVLVLQSSEENRGDSLIPIPREFRAFPRSQPLVLLFRADQMGFPSDFFLQNMKISEYSLEAWGSVLSSFGTQPRDSNWHFGLTSEAPVPPGVATSSSKARSNAARGKV